MFKIASSQILQITWLFPSFDSHAAGLATRNRRSICIVSSELKRWILIRRVGALQETSVRTCCDAGGIFRCLGLLTTWKGAIVEDCEIDCCSDWKISSLGRVSRIDSLRVVLTSNNGRFQVARSETGGSMLSTQTNITGHCGRISVFGA